MLSINTFSQEIKFFNQRPDRNITLGLGGDGGVVSLHHEKLNIISYNFILATELGLGASQDVSIVEPNHYYLSIPFNISACFGKRMHLFEAGLGSTIHLRINDPFYEFCIYPISWSCINYIFSINNRAFIYLIFRIHSFSKSYDRCYFT